MEDEVLQDQEELVEVTLDEDGAAEKLDQAGGGAAAEDGAEGGKGTAAEGSQQTPAAQGEEERHRQAAARRAREEAERQRAHQAEIDAIYGKAFAGQGDPYHGGRPIRSKADYDAYIAARDADEKQKRMAQMKESGVDPELLQELIRDAVNTNPAVQQAGAAMQQANAAMAQAHQEKVQNTIEKELAAIRSVDPEIRTADDLHDRYPDTWEETLALCKQGVPLSKAFKTANFDALMKNRSAAARQAEKNSAASKAHLKPSKSNNQSTVTIPREVLEQFRLLLPGKSDAEYAAYWAKHHKEGV